MTIRIHAIGGGIVQVTIDASAGETTYTLPGSYATGRVIQVRRSDNTGGQVATVAVTSGGVLDGVLNGTSTIAADTSTQFESGDGNSWQSYGPGSGGVDSGPAAGSDNWLKAYSNLDQIITGAITRDGNGAATSAGVVWPDGTAGTYTATTVSSAFPGAVDAYTITYAGSPTKTVTQTAVTRDPTTGAVTTRPAMTVA